jgi:Dolichyl-phosphate-mannose-protein mannosyltransferase
MRPSENFKLGLARTVGALRVLVVFFCAGFILIDLSIIFLRLFYPYQLEWMEGASLVQVHRILLEQPLFVKPSVDFVPLIYPPFYFYLAAGIARLFGFGFGPLRIVSLISSAACGIVLFLAVVDHSRSKLAGFLAVGFFASTFMLVGQWFDIARVDMLATALTVLAIYLSIRPRSGNLPTALVCAGLFFSLAIFTKQSSLAVALTANLYFLIFDWRRGIWLSVSVIISTFILWGIFSLGGNGWIGYYLISIPAAHAFDFKPGRIISVLIGQFSPILIFLLAAIAPMLVAPRKVFSDPVYRYYLVIAGALIVTSVVSRLNAFSSRNVYVSTYLAIALLVGLEAGWLLEWVRTPPPLKAGQGLLALEWGMVLIQFITQIPAYLQTRTVPTQSDQAAGAALVTRIKNYDGDVLLLDNNYLALYAGKRPFFNEMPMSEISGQGNLHPMPEWSELHSEIDNLFHSSTTSAILVDFSQPVQDFISDCHQVQIRYPDKTTFIPVAGPNSRPNLVITCR